jgi:transcriptional regulator with XRE-family HTH domain
MDGLATDNDLYRWEKGLHKPMDDTLTAIARALGRDYAWAIGLTPDEPESEPEQTPSAEEHPENADRLVRIEDQVDAIGKKLAALFQAIGPKPTAGSSVQESVASIRKDLDELLTYRRQTLEQLRKLDLEDAPEFLNILLQQARQDRGAAGSEPQPPAAEGHQGQGG